MARAQKSIREVLNEEIKLVGHRRRKLEQQDAIAKEDVEPDNPHDSSDDHRARSGLTGLALSGGGVRAAAFSLGFLQGMYSAGRMKAFDFLSTVSGGGYAGALFSSEVARKMSVNWERRGDTLGPESLNRLELEQNADGSQSDRVMRLAMHGRMMTNVLRLFSRHLWGFLVNVTFVVSGIVAVAALLAYIMRWPWGHDVFPVLRELNFNIDPLVPFFFAFMAFLAWIASHFLTYLAKVLNRRIPEITQYTYVTLIAFVALGIVSLLALGEVDLTSLIASHNWDESIYVRINSAISWIGYGLFGLLMTTLLPYFTPRRLLKSGRQEAGPIQHFIFGVAGKALLFGAPLYLFYFLSSENLSGYRDLRDDSDQMVLTHIKLPERLVGKLESEWFAETPLERHVARRLLHAINNKSDGKDTTAGHYSNDRSPDLEQEVIRFIDDLASQNKDDSEIGFATRWAQWFAHLIGISDEFDERVKRFMRIRTEKEKIVNRINRDCLSDPRLFLELSPTTEEKTSANDFGFFGMLSIAKGDPSNQKQPKSRIELVADSFDKDSVGKETALKTLKKIDSAKRQLAKYSFATHATSDVKQNAAGQPNETKQWYATIESALDDIAHGSSATQTQRSGRDPVVQSLLAAAGNTNADSPEKLLQSLQQALASDIAFYAAMGRSDRDAGQKRQRLATVIDSWLRDGIPASGNGPINRNEDESPQTIRQQVAARVSGQAQLKSRPADGDTEKTRSEINGRFVHHLQQILNQSEGEFLEATGFQQNDLQEEEFKAKVEQERVQQARQVNEWVREIRENNWVLLNAMYPDYILPQKTTFAYVVNAKDQEFRVTIGLVAAFIFFAIGLGTSLNSTSLHGVYKDQMSELWLADPNMKLNELDTCDRGGPFHLFNATVNRMGHRNDPDLERRSRFVLSNLFCGSKKIGYRETVDYEDGDIEVGSALAISGAAVTSVSAPTFLHMLILFLTNFRLGRWLVNPQTYATDHYWPSPIRCFTNTLWNPEQRSYLFVSDGGHLENLGIASLLERRCKFMVCVDGSYDPQYKFNDLRKAIHAARAKYGIKVRCYSGNENADSGVPSQWLEALKVKSESQYSKEHFVVFEVEYPEKELPKAILVYCKLTTTGDEPIELVELSRNDKHFPHDPTTNQFLSPDTFDAYMTLGQCIASEVDQFVREGRLDHYSLPLGWHGEGHTPPPAAGASEETTSNDPMPPAPARSPAKTTTSVPENSEPEDLAVQSLEAQLQATDFDENGIEFVTETIENWFTNVKRCDVIDQEDATIDYVLSWAKEKGIDASRELRQSFCSKLAEFGTLHAHIVSEDAELASLLGQILNALDGRSELAKRFLKNSVAVAKRTASSATDHAKG